MPRALGAARRPCGARGSHPRRSWRSIASCTFLIAIGADIASMVGGASGHTDGLTTLVVGGGVVESWSSARRRPFQRRGRVPASMKAAAEGLGLQAVAQDLGW